MEPTDQEFEVIKNLLRNNEETYRPGAWEDFSSKNKKKKKTTLWPVMSGVAAAIILIISGIFSSIEQKQDPAHILPADLDPKIVQMNKGKGIAHPPSSSASILKSDSLENTVLAAKVSKTTPLENTVLADQISEASPLENTALTNKVSKTTPLENTALTNNVSKASPLENTALTNKVFKASPLENTALTNKVSKTTPLENTALTNKVSKASPLEKTMLADQVSESAALEKVAVKNKTSENKIAATDPSEKLKALAAFPGYKQPLVYADNPQTWDIGLLLSGSLQDLKKTNIGVAATVGYALNSKISITSGVGYLQIAGSKGGESQLSATEEGKSLESVNIRFRGIDIPLGITYHLTKNTYANVGVSAFSVLRKSGEKSYLNSISTQRGFVNSSGDLQYETVIVQEKSVESLDLNQHTEESTDYIGLINLSIGYKQKIFDSKRILLAPFLKLPMRTTTKEQIHLFSAGLNIGLIF